MSESQMKCKSCNQPLHKDQTNNGVVTRCRNPACPVTVVNLEEYGGGYAS